MFTLILVSRCLTLSMRQMKLVLFIGAIKSNDIKKVFNSLCQVSAMGMVDEAILQPLMLHQANKARQAMDASKIHQA